MLCNIYMYYGRTHMYYILTVLFIYLQVISIFNLFITYGDTFLPNPNSYDELYYEIIRVHQTFDNLYSMGRYFTPVLTHDSTWVPKLYIGDWCSCNNTNIQIPPPPPPWGGVGGGEFQLLKTMFFSLTTFNYMYIHCNKKYTYFCQ